MGNQKDKTRRSVGTKKGGYSTCLVVQDESQPADCVALLQAAHCHCRGGDPFTARLLKH